jgi:hypothetical protein
MDLLQDRYNKGSSAFKELIKKSKFVKKKIMETTGIREKLHQFIDTIEDKKAEAIYTLFEDEIEQNEWEYTKTLKLNWTSVMNIIKVAAR